MKIFNWGDHYYNKKNFLFTFTLKRSLNLRKNDYNAIKTLFANTYLQIFWHFRLYNVFCYTTTGTISRLTIPLILFQASKNTQALRLIKKTKSGLITELFYYLSPLRFTNFQGCLPFTLLIAVQPKTSACLVELPIDWTLAFAIPHSIT